MAPQLSNNMPLIQRSDSLLSLKSCVANSEATSISQKCCPLASTCVPNSNLCAMPFLSSENVPGKQLFVEQVHCIVRLTDKSNTSSADSPSSTIDVLFPSNYDSSYPTQDDQGSDNDAPATPLLFTYPLLILAFIAIAMGGAFMYYRMKKVRSQQQDGESGSRSNDDDNCPNNDSTVDLELPSYEEHAWNSRWAPTGRNRSRGNAGEIVEVVQLRSERGVLVPVAVVRGSMYVEPGEESTENGGQEKSRSKAWLAKAKGKFGRGTDNEGIERQRQGAEWSVQPPAYAERFDGVPGIKAPEPAVTR